MVLGPSYFYNCPNCDHFLTRGSIMSGNTFGATIYSDGKRIAPMLPEFPNLTKCKKCNCIFWLSKLKEIEIYDWNEDDKKKYQNADLVDFLDIEDYFDALDKGLADHNEEELMIRQRIWWAYNDKIRNNENIFNDENDELAWKENVTKLIALLEYSDINQRVMIAELYRNLGDFERCIHTIQSIEDDELNWLKEKFINECNLKNNMVVKLN